MKKIVLLVICAASASMVSSCTKVNVENISVIMPSGAPTLAMHSIINDKNFEDTVETLKKLMFKVNDCKSKFILIKTIYILFMSINQL